MKSARSVVPIVVFLSAALVTSRGPRAEIVEEIIAWVNGDIITLSQYQAEEKMQVAELYQQFSGEELDRKVEQARKELLLSMIDRKIVLHRAKAIGYDLEKMGERYLEMFMQTQNIKTDAELQQMAEQSGMTVDEVVEWLTEMHAPRDVIDLEVANRISISDQEIEAFYEANPSVFVVEGEVTLREIVLLADGAHARDGRRDEAQQIWQRASSGEDFAALAAEVSEAGTAAGGGKIGPLKRSDLSDVLVAPAFDLPVGNVSELMETPYGFHIVKVETRTDEYKKTLDEVRDRVRDHLRQERFMTELEAFLKKARAESEWCVKPKHHDLLSIPAPPICDRS